MRIWIRNIDFFLANLRNLRFSDWDTKGIRGICDLQINYYKFEDLRFAE
jgi:hypothetical protein